MHALETSGYPTSCQWPPLDSPCGTHESDVATSTRTGDVDGMEWELAEWYVGGMECSGMECGHSGLEWGHTSGNPWRNNRSGLDLSPEVTQWNFIPLAFTYSCEPRDESERQAGGTAESLHTCT